MLGAPSLASKNLAARETFGGEKALPVGGGACGTLPALLYLLHSSVASVSQKSSVCVRGCGCRRGAGWLLKVDPCSRHQQTQDAEGLSGWFDSQRCSPVPWGGGTFHCPGKHTHLRTGRHHRSLSEHQDPCLLFSGARSLQGGI